MKEAKIKKSEVADSRLDQKDSIALDQDRLKSQYSIRVKAFIDRIASTADKNQEIPREMNQKKGKMIGLMLCN